MGEEELCGRMVACGIVLWVSHGVRVRRDGVGSRRRLSFVVAFALLVFGFGVLLNFEFPASGLSRYPSQQEHVRPLRLSPEPWDERAQVYIPLPPLSAPFPVQYSSSYA